MPMQRLKHRKEFLRVAKAGRHAATEGLALQAFRRNPDMQAGEEPRVGFTTSKKVGNAVKRNRARRRLRAAADQVLRESGRPFFDYVLIGRTATVDRDFAALTSDLRSALERVHRPRKSRPGRAAEAAE